MPSIYRKSTYSSISDRFAPDVENLVEDVEYSHFDRILHGFRGGVSGMQDSFEKKSVYCTLPLAGSAIDAKNFWYAI